jgi:hypothetical protein
MAGRETWPDVVTHAPRELTSGRLRRLGEGIGKVVYASDHWVVQRQRSPSEIVALIVLWKALRRVEHLLPGRFGTELLRKPSRQIRFLRVTVQFGMLILPKSAWFTTHIQSVWRTYHRNSRRGERLAQKHLAGTPLVPDRVTFPPVRVRIGGWPGWLVTSEATERVEATLDRRLGELAAAGRFDEFERWLDRFLALRRAGWKCGLFSLDAHLKNFGVCGDHVVLIDSGGLTDRWQDVETKLTLEQEAEEPHVRLGMGAMLAERPDIARRFDEKWRATVTPEVVSDHWEMRNG